MRRLGREGGAAGGAEPTLPRVRPARIAARAGWSGAASRGGAGGGGGGAGGAGPARRGAAAALRAGADLTQGQRTRGRAGERAGAAPAGRSFWLPQRRTARLPTAAEMSAGECGDRKTGASPSWIWAQQGL